MSLAEKFSLSSALFFFITGLITGVWKYYHIATTKNGVAPIYVDIAHRTSLLYSFACLLLAKLASLSEFSDEVNFWAAFSAIFFFAFAVTTYVIHGILRDTDNQFRSPHQLASFTLPGWTFKVSMFFLILGELGGSLVLGIGAMRAIW